MFDNCFHNFTIIFRYNQMVTVCCPIQFIKDKYLPKQGEKHMKKENRKAAQQRRLFH